VDCSLSLGADGAVLTSYERWAMAHPQLRSPPKEQESADSGSLKSSAGNGVVRPRVYVYELPPRFTSHLLYAHHPMEYNSIYSAGRFLHMRLLASEFRTTDPEQADYFFVPVWGRAAGSGPPRYRSKYLIEVRAASSCVRSDDTCTPRLRSEGRAARSATGASNTQATLLSCPYHASSSRVRQLSCSSGVRPVSTGPHTASMV
jgi:hypothetical protein